MSGIATDALSGESEIFWLHDVSRCDYVRETLASCGTRRRPPPTTALPPGRILGYALLRPDAPTVHGSFPRRVFWVKKYDRSESPADCYATGCPAEAVDPRTVAPGVPGRLTPRALGAHK